MQHSLVKFFLNFCLTVFILSNVFTLSSCQSMNSRGSNILPKQKYVSGIEDLPVLDGCEKEKSSQDMVFDSEAGRIINASYSCAGIGSKSIRDFYSQTLPQLGWDKTNKIVANSASQIGYTRDGEQLILQMKTKKLENTTNVTSLVFKVQPVKR